MSKISPELAGAIVQEGERNAYIERTHIMLDGMEAGLQATLGQFGAVINSFMRYQGFWESSNIGEKIALMHSELSEALEADRKQLTSDHIPDFAGVEEELADCILRILDFATQHKLRLPEALIAKMQYNLTRPHKHGKAY